MTLFCMKLKCSIQLDVGFVVGSGDFVVVVDDDDALLVYLFSFFQNRISVCNPAPELALCPRQPSKSETGIPLPPDYCN